MADHEENTRLRERIVRLETELQKLRLQATQVVSPAVRVSGFDVEWNLDAGVCTLAGLPVAMMWVDSTLAGLMSGVQAMVGTERFLLAVQSEGRKSVEDDWQVISNFERFEADGMAWSRLAGALDGERFRFQKLNQ